MLKSNLMETEVWSIEQGVQFLSENLHSPSLSAEEYRYIFDELAARFLKAEFGISDIDSISEKMYNDLYHKLVQIEVQETELDESEDGDGYSYRGQLASAIVTEMGENFREAKYGETS